MNNSKFLTLLLVIAPTTAGATKPGIAANVFVMPTRVPTLNRI